MTFKIEKGVPMPAKKKVSAVSEAAMAMEVGDSVLTDYTTRGPAAGFAALCRHAGHPERRFKSAVEGDKVRVWRVA